MQTHEETLWSGGLPRVRNEIRRRERRRRGVWGACSCRRCDLLLSVTTRFLARGGDDYENNKQLRYQGIKVRSGVFSRWYRRASGVPRRLRKRRRRRRRRRRPAAKENILILCIFDRFVELGVVIFALESRIRHKDWFLEVQSDVSIAVDAAVEAPSGAADELRRSPALPIGSKLAARRTLRGLPTCEVLVSGDGRRRRHTR